jgi:hypothetical protein
VSFTARSLNSYALASILLLSSIAPSVSLADYGWGTSKQIEDREKAAAAHAAKNFNIPTPKGKLWESLKEALKLKVTPKDSVLVSVAFPQGWTMLSDQDDRSRRRYLILDKKGREVGSTFLKNTGYDYYGSTSLNEEAVKSILAENAGVPVKSVELGRTSYFVPICLVGTGVVAAVAVYYLRCTETKARTASECHSLKT